MLEVGEIVSTNNKTQFLSMNVSATAATATAAAAINRSTAATAAVSAAGNGYGKNALNSNSPLSQLD